jgi:hypothetical protein
VNRELRDLLVAGGYSRAARPDFRWHDVIVHRNIASIPPVRQNGGSALLNHGFNLILLDEHGAPTHYAKCRPAVVPETQHEVTVLTVLAADPALAEIIPATRSASSATLSVQVSRFIGDRTWASDPSRGDIAAWTRATREILVVMLQLAERADALLPDLGSQREIRPRDALRPLLSALAAVGLPSESQDVLLSAADSAPALATHPQHGDLWPANLIQRPNGGWWVLDFEMYGRVRMPLHDVFHLVRTSTSPDEVTWLRRLAAGDDWARAQQQIIREAAARHAIPASALTALAIYYFAEMTARLHRSGTPRSFWEPYLSEVHEAVGFLNASGTLEDLLLG